MDGSQVWYEVLSYAQEGQELRLRKQADAIFQERASPAGAVRPELERMLSLIGEGDTVVCASMIHLGNELAELSAIVGRVVERGARVEFVNEALTFGIREGESRQLFRAMTAFVAFEAAVQAGRRRMGIAIAREKGKYKGRKAKLSADQANELRRRAEAGESKTALAQEFRISRETLYGYLRRGAT